ncbi:hypothetical protein ACMAY5_01040 [Arenicellales bacterium nBUS_48]
MPRSARSTNFLRPIYRLGWFMIWSFWLATLGILIPSFMPHDDVVGWGFLSIAATAAAYLLNRLWDWWIVGRSLTFRHR